MAEKLSRLPKRPPRRIDPGPLLAFVPKTTPEYRSPDHLTPLADILTRCRTESVRACFSVPPRHGKSDLVFHAIAWLLLQDPTLPIAYLTYGDTFAVEQVEKCRRICERAGVKLDVQRQGYFSTTDGGSVTGESIQGQLTGRGYRLIIVDDPHKNRQEAESPTVRKRVIEGFENDIFTRQEPAGTSVIVVHTRWHVGDLIGHLVNERGWSWVNLPAVNDNGDALAPWMWPLETLAPFRANAYSWASLYQGNPVPRGSSVFGSPTYCLMADVPKGRATLGLDLAYTKKTHADHSISLALVEGPKVERIDEGGKKILKPTFYVADVERHQCTAPEFVPVLKRHQTQWPGARKRWYASGTEKGSADFIIAEGVPINVVNATADKFVRAQPVADAWNDCRVFVPRDARWASVFVKVVTGFTGLDGEEDDDVDALAAAHDEATDRPFEMKSFRIAI